MLIGVIQKKNLADVDALLRRIEPGLYDCLELRLDGCSRTEALHIAEHVCAMPLPIIVTLRSRAEGGLFTGTEPERIALLEELAALHPDYLDIEAALPGAVIAKIRAIAPQTRIILSWHDFTGTPESLEDVLSAMQAKADGVHYKLAALAHTTPDALRMMLFCREQTQNGLSLTGISMGEHGITTRILAPIMHQGFCYCPLEETTAPGQLDARTLRSTYHFPALHQKTAVYGLIGDPVAQSVGHLYHNDRNAENGCAAVYVKWHLTQAELAQGLDLLARLGVQGLSVTMPHKEAILPLLSAYDDVVRCSGAANTLKAADAGFVGTNTDGAGALNALPVDVAGKHIVILGAGGAAKAVMAEGVRRGASFSVFNRTVEKTLPIESIIRPFTELGALQSEPWDCIINALPFTLTFPFDAIPFAAGRLAVDLSYGKQSVFLQAATAAGCTVVDGRDMFERQALMQRQYWGLDAY